MADGCSGVGVLGGSTGQHNIDTGVAYGSPTPDCIIPDCLIVIEDSIVWEPSPMPPEGPGGGAGWPFVFEKRRFRIGSSPVPGHRKLYYSGGVIECLKVCDMAEDCTAGSTHIGATGHRSGHFGRGHGGEWCANTACAARRVQPTPPMPHLMHINPD